MDNPETLVTLGTQETGRRQTTHRKLKRLSTRTPLQTQVLEKGTVKYSNFIIYHFLLISMIMEGFVTRV
jgi:hypothetical protein